MTSLWSFIKLSRPHFLLGGALLFGLGASYAGGIGAGRYVLGQAMVTTAQVTAHYVNEFADLEADRHIARRTFFSGGSGVLVSGELAPRVALRAATVSSGVAAVLIAVVASVEPVAAAIGVAALAVSWSYSMPPARLLGTGLGEAVTSLVVAVLVPLVGVLVQGDSPPAGLWWSAAVLFPVHLPMMLAFELPDLETDAAAGKRVLAVRLGFSRAQVLIVVLYAAAGAIAALGALVGGLEDGRAGATAVGIVPATVVVAAMRSGRHWLLTASAVATLVVVASALLVAGMA